MAQRDDAEDIGELPSATPAMIFATLILEAFVATLRPRQQLDFLRRLSVLMDDPEAATVVGIRSKIDGTDWKRDLRAVRAWYRTKLPGMLKRRR